MNLEKFKEEERPEEEARVGGLADRENQQGSTCYMSAMLEFYDDGEECDDKTEEDLIFLKDTATNFTLSVRLPPPRNTSLNSSSSWPLNAATTCASASRASSSGTPAPSRSTSSYDIITRCDFPPARDI